VISLSVASAVRFRVGQRRHPEAGVVPHDECQPDGRVARFMLTTVLRGTTVTWINNDTSTHDNVADRDAFNTGDIAPGGEANFT
jgi:plastocyanin